MPPEKPLPYSAEFQDIEEYVTALLEFVTSSDMYQTMCGGVHILDFMTQEPDLYTTILPQDWREWLEHVDIMDFLELLMRDDLSPLLEAHTSKSVQDKGTGNISWRQYSIPPQSLLEYIKSIRRLSLDQEFHWPRGRSESHMSGLSRKLSIGMTSKKAHEVQNFAAFVDDLANNITANSSQPISHLLDFGSGQNYLGRVLASSMYSRQVIAVERRHHNVDGARRMDVNARLSEKQVIWRNKKQWKATGVDTAQEDQKARLATTVADLTQAEQVPEIEKMSDKGAILHVEHEIQNGDLDPVIKQVESLESKSKSMSGPQTGESGINSRNVLCISLHSCGNLSHHGIRSLVLNPCVRGIALIGCCYNLATERLGPPTYKLPSLRPANERLERTSASQDPHGFPMSDRMASYKHKNGPGLRINITARMMAVQAPRNWTETECESFFTRHFYRALLQKLFLDRGFIEQPVAQDHSFGGVSPAGTGGGGGQPIILGSLRKSCYQSFVTYVHGALDKLKNDPDRGEVLLKCMDGLTDQEIEDYEKRFQNHRHHLCLVWSLMAFSAVVVESTMVTDRLLFLREQPSVRKSWVETVFDYKQSPRNLVVVGLK